MPTYQYACTACDERLEAVQSFTDAPLTECPACGGTLRKVFSAVGVVFKGSGFYKTDSRGKSADSPKSRLEVGHGQRRQGRRHGEQRQQQQRRQRRQEGELVLHPSRSSTGEQERLSPLWTARAARRPVVRRP